jgi:hypothetical protein
MCIAAVTSEKRTETSVNKFHVCFPFGSQKTQRREPIAIEIRRVSCDSFLCFPLLNAKFTRWELIKAKPWIFHCRDKTNICIRYKSELLCIVNLGYKVIFTNSCIVSEST